MPTEYRPNEETLTACRGVLEKPADHNSLTRRLAFCVLMMAQGVRVVQSDLPPRLLAHRRRRMNADAIFDAARIAAIGIAVTAALALTFWHTAQALDSLIASGGW